MSPAEQLLDKLRPGERIESPRAFVALLAQSRAPGAPA
jgi:hypothetical protein